MRISDWSSDVCSSDLIEVTALGRDRNELDRGRFIFAWHSASIDDEYGRGLLAPDFDGLVETLWGQHVIQMREMLAIDAFDKSIHVCLLEGAFSVSAFAFWIWIVAFPEIGRAHVRTQVTNVHLVFHLLHDKQQ